MSVSWVMEQSGFKPDSVSKSQRLYEQLAFYRVLILVQDLAQPAETWLLFS